MAGRSSTTEKAIIEQWFKEAKAAADEEADIGQYNERKALVLNNIKAVMQHGVARKSRAPELHYLRWVAAACILGFVVVAYMFRDRITPPVMYTVVTDQYQVKEVVLPDSSTVVLNVNSRLCYPVKFNGKRSVTLSGEAFFDIRKNPDARFVVNASHLQVNVLGTSFVVSDAGIAEMALVGVKTGRVQVNASGKQPSSSVLSPGQQFVFAVRRGESKIENNIAINTDWTAQLLVFRDTPLSVVFPAIAKSLHVRIVSNNSEINKRTFTGSFLKEDNINEILKILSLSYGLKIKQTGDLIEVN
ncbi:FecR family protein [Chitinophaga qingshengii]|uniref:FecR domain-containing protein n=1 Tax=Chitinophaga qingshengii TaxID=1569794 RepID=A0ABR7TWK5_9BACT|nr:FecR domain-containing protein [Chitinophaga qingshengii]MBC9934455.1 FecR domain-containing protein [Chitinophaga qingshengii]